MHKKSIEAADKLKDEPGIDDLDPKTHSLDDNLLTSSVMSRDKEEFRSESIAALRAKALSYSAQLRDAIQTETLSMRTTEMCSSFDTPTSNETEDSDTLVDPTNWYIVCLIVSLSSFYCTKCKYLVMLLIY